MFLVIDEAGNEPESGLADVVEAIFQRGLPVLNVAEDEVLRGVEGDIPRKLPGEMAVG